MLLQLLGLVSLCLSSYGQTVVPSPGQIVSFKPFFDDETVCLTADSNTDGAPVYAAQCNLDVANRSWNVTAGVNKSGPIKIFGNKCLDVKDGVDANGTLLQVWTCVAGNTNQQFVVDTTNGFKWNRDRTKCLDLKDGKALTSVRDGNPVQIWTCFEANDNQQWVATSIAEPKPVSPGGSALIGKSVTVNEASTCIAAGNDSDVSALTFVLCNNGPLANWTLTAGSSTSGPGPAGQIKLAPSNKCITVPNGDTTDGTKVQVTACVDGDVNQSWTVNGDLTIRFASNTAKCLDLTDGNSNVGTLIQIWDCAKFNSNQQWERFQVT